MLVCDIDGFYIGFILKRRKSLQIQETFYPRLGLTLNEIHCIVNGQGIRDCSKCKSKKSLAFTCVPNFAFGCSHDLKVVGLSL